jgi:hypothetical protein
LTLRWVPLYTDAETVNFDGYLTLTTTLRNRG